MSKLVVRCVADPLAQPRWWRDGAMFAGGCALWLCAALFSSMWSTAAIAIVGLAYLLGRSRFAFPLRVDDAFVSHSGHRVPIEGAKIVVRAWTGAGGRIGAALSIGEGRRGIVIGCKGSDVDCTSATSAVDVVVGASDFARLVHRFVPTLDAPIYRQPALVTSRRLWTNPAVRGSAWMIAAGVAFQIVASMVHNRYPELWAFWIATAYTAAAAWLSRRPIEVTQRALVLTGASVRLESSDGTALWTVIDAQKRARVSGHGDAQTLELDPRTYPLRRIARGGLVREHEEISAHLSAQDFDALVLVLGLGAPPTRVEIEAEDDDDEAREERKRSERK